MSQPFVDESRPAIERLLEAVNRLERASSKGISGSSINVIQTGTAVSWILGAMGFGLAIGLGFALMFMARDQSRMETYIRDHEAWIGIITSKVPEIKAEYEKAKLEQDDGKQ